MTEETQSALDIEKLVRAFIRLRDARAKLEAEFKENDAELEAKQDMIRKALLQHCKDNNLSGIKTEAGNVTRGIRKRIWTNDWEGFNKFLLDNEAPYLLEKRIHQGNMAQFLEENPNVPPPPGLNIDQEYTITVTKQRKKV